MLWGLKASCVPVEGLWGLPKAVVPAPTPIPPQFPATTPHPHSSHQPPWGDNYLSQVLSTGAVPPTLASCSKSPEPGAEQPRGPGRRVNIPVLPGDTTHLPAPPPKPQTLVPQRGWDCAPRHEQSRVVIGGLAHLALSIFDHQHLRSSASWTQRPRMCGSLPVAQATGSQFQAVPRLLRF